MMGILRSFTRKSHRNLSVFPFSVLPDNFTFQSWMFHVCLAKLFFFPSLTIAAIGELR